MEVKWWTNQKWRSESFVPFYKRKFTVVGFRFQMTCPKDNPEIWEISSSVITCSNHCVLESSRSLRNRGNLMIYFCMIASLPNAMLWDVALWYWLTNKNHHPHADDLLLLIICRKKEGESHRLAVYWKDALPRRLVYNFGCLSGLENRKIGFPLEMDFCLRWRLTCSWDPDGVTLYWIYILVASDRQVVNGFIAQNYVFFSFSGQAIARRMLSQKGRKKKGICYIAFF